MSATVVLGAQWGDEGKGKLVNILASEVTLCCRAAGGNNAGHHCCKWCQVVHIPSLFSELDTLKAKGLDTTEAALGKAKVGTTGKGIGLCYSFKMDRSGVPVSEVAFDKQTVDLKLRNLARKMQSRYKDLSGFDVEEEILQLDRFGGRLQPLVVNSALLISKAQADQEKLLIECTNALMLDIDHGTYPYVISSSACLAGCFTGLAGLRPKTVHQVIGVVKAYTTRVGNGPLPTNLSKLDVLDTFAKIKVAVAYHLHDHVSGARIKTLESFPKDLRLFDRTSPQGRIEIKYKSFKGWQKSIVGVTSWDNLPELAKEYVQWLEEAIGCLLSI